MWETNFLTKGTCFRNKNPESSHLRSQKAAKNITVPTVLRSFRYLQLSSQRFQINHNLHTHYDSESNDDHSLIAKASLGKYTPLRRLV